VVLVLLEVANKFCSMSSQAGKNVVDVFDANMRRRMPIVFAGAFG
jgi:hypothetical protein